MSGHPVLLLLEELGRISLIGLPDGSILEEQGPLWKGGTQFLVWSRDPLEQPQPGVLDMLVQPVEPLPTAVFSPHLRIAFLSNITASSCTSPRRKAALGECAHGGAPRQAPGRVGAAAHSPA